MLTVNSLLKQEWGYSRRAMAKMYVSLLGRRYFWTTTLPPLSLKMMAYYLSSPPESSITKSSARFLSYAIAILTKLKNLRESGAGGPDGLSPCVLKKLAPSIALPALHYVWRVFHQWLRPASLEDCICQTHPKRRLRLFWKHLQANITITGTRSKIMEAIISDHMSMLPVAKRTNIRWSS